MSRILPANYCERVYAGVLGKIIGVYLGRPIEGWTHERIHRELGEIHTYVQGRHGVPLVVTDDDITGTFTFLRALPDSGNAANLTPQQVAQAWLNYIIPKRTILWWGGLGISTEHTAYLRLQRGIRAPDSGSIGRNGRTVAEQIGAQIFIDGWAMVAPGDPELAADLARRAASVSHDGEAVHAAQVLAAMEALAFVEPDRNHLLDAAINLIPRDSLIYRLIAELREQHAREGNWYATRRWIADNYGYDKYPGVCHVVPNHALIILGLLYGEDDFARSLMIVNTSGWDTDCNSGNLGCLLGIKNGLAGLEAGHDWRGPIADRLYLPTADGGRAITDALSEAYRIVNIGHALAQQRPLAPKGGARFHFSLSGSVQGFQAEHDEECARAVLTNVAFDDGRHVLAIQCEDLSPERPARAATATFIPREALNLPYYELLASPTLYPGQRLRARVLADAANQGDIDVRLFVRVYQEDDASGLILGPPRRLAPAYSTELEWVVPDTDGAPVHEVGVHINSDAPAATVYLDFMTWDGSPSVTLRRSRFGSLWQRAWVDAVDHFDRAPGSRPLRIAQDRGVGLLMHGTQEWRDYRVTARVTPRLAEAAGVAARVQGMRRYYALVLVRGGKARLVKALDDVVVLGETDFAWDFDEPHDFELEVVGDEVCGAIDGQRLFRILDTDRPLQGGAVALLATEGGMSTESVRVTHTPPPGVHASSTLPLSRSSSSEYR